MSIEPDTKDWTWVLDRPCPECGFVAGAITADRLGELVRDNATAWAGALREPQVRVRPRPEVWSTLEYACHVRDVHRVFAARLRLMLEASDGEVPRFPDWDQDATALEGRYDTQEPAIVSDELVEAAATVADGYDAVPPGDWGRRGVRSNGSEFSVESLGRYHLHDVVHHLWDIDQAAKAATIAAYDASATEYGREEIDEHLRSVLDRFLTHLRPGAHVLEIGSGHGRDARALEAAGCRVRRTDVSTGFVERLRGEGHRADLLDPAVDELRDPAAPQTPYDAVWANACLLHAARTEMPRLLRRLAEVTRPGGVLYVSLKEGDGEAWSTHGAISAPRRFVYWREASLREALAGAGWDVVEVGHSAAAGSDRAEVWLDVLARLPEGAR